MLERPSAPVGAVVVAFAAADVSSSLSASMAALVRPCRRRRAAPSFPQPPTRDGHQPQVTSDTVVAMVNSVGYGGCLLTRFMAIRWERVRANHWERLRAISSAAEGVVLIFWRRRRGWCGFYGNGGGPLGV